MACSDDSHDYIQKSLKVATEKLPWILHGLTEIYRYTSTGYSKTALHAWIGMTDRWPLVMNRSVIIPDLDR